MCTITGVSGPRSATVSATRWETSYLGSVARHPLVPIGNERAAPISNGKQRSGGPASAGRAEANVAAVMAATISRRRRVISDSLLHDKTRLDTSLLTPAEPKRVARRLGTWFADHLSDALEPRPFPTHLVSG